MTHNPFSSFQMTTMAQQVVFGGLGGACSVLACHGYHLSESLSWVPIMLPCWGPAGPGHILIYAFAM